MVIEYQHFKGKDLQKMTMDPIRFQDACHQIINQSREKNGIGTLGEKTVHAVLKKYLEPNEKYHEIKIESYFADISTPNGIIEIQTRNFNNLRKKLKVFLELGTVTIAYPIPYTKWLLWIDEETGEISKKRKSPQQGNVCMVLPELYSIKEFLLHPNLKIHLLLINMEESRLLNGWSKDKKKGSTRYDRIPIALMEEMWITNKTDYANIIPSSLTDEFTAKDFQKASRLSPKKASFAIQVLRHVGAIEQIGMRGRSYVYQTSTRFASCLINKKRMC